MDNTEIDFFVAIQDQDEDLALKAAMRNLRGSATPVPPASTMPPTEPSPVPPLPRS
jgi:hypothetical protein